MVRRHKKVEDKGRNRTKRHGRHTSVPGHPQHKNALRGRESAPEPLPAADRGPKQPAAGDSGDVLSRTLWTLAQSDGARTMQRTCGTGNPDVQATLLLQTVLANGHNPAGDFGGGSAILGMLHDIGPRDTVEGLVTFGW